jgi:thymidylate synthase (FAD)
MRIIEPSAKEIKETDLLKKIEMIGRTCYKSNNLIKEGSAEKFVRGLSTSKHYAMLEHGIVHFYITSSLTMGCLFNHLSEQAYILMDKYTYLTELPRNTGWLWTMNLRTLVEMSETDNHIKKMTKSLLDKYAFALGIKEKDEPSHFDTEYKRIYTLSDDGVIDLLDDNFDSAEDFERECNKHIFRTFLLTTDRGVTHELVRHRPCSFAQASTRYCNYSKDKFGNEITVIKPLFDENSDAYRIWKQGCEHDEKTYFDLLNCGCKPEEARGNLPTDLATELIITANYEEWKHIFDLRYKGTTGKPHPKCKEVIEKVYNLF